MFARHPSPTHQGPLRQFLAAAALVACVGLAACTTVQQPTSAAAPAVDPVRLPSQDLEFDGGTCLFSGFTVPFEGTVPDDWSYINDGVPRRDVGDTEGVFVWPGHAAYVPEEACDWTDTIADVAPSVSALVDALSAYHHNRAN